MQWVLVTIFVFILAGLSDCGLLKSDHRVIREVNSRDFFGVSALDVYVATCKQNGYPDSEQKLTDLDAGSSRCSQKVSLTESKQERLKEYDECYSELLTEAKKCMKDYQQYYPDAILQIKREVRDFMIDHLKGYKSTKECVIQALTGEGLTALRRCVHQSAADVGDTSKIITEKDVFCQRLEAETQCFPKVITQVCDDTEGNRIFKVKFFNATMSPCH